MTSFTNRLNSDIYFTPHHVRSGCLDWVGRGYAPIFFRCVLNFSSAQANTYCAPAVNAIWTAAYLTASLPRAELGRILDGRTGGIVNAARRVGEMAHEVGGRGFGAGRANRRIHKVQKK